MLRQPGLAEVVVRVRRPLGHRHEGTSPTSVTCRSSGGRSSRNEAKIKRSYATLRAPARKNGRLSAATLTAHPVTAGATAEAVLRATLVRPAAAVRSSGSTTAIV